MSASLSSGRYSVRLTRNREIRSLRTRFDFSSNFRSSCENKIIESVQTRRGFFSTRELTEQITGYRYDYTLTRLDENDRDRERFDRTFRNFRERATTIPVKEREFSDTPLTKEKGKHSLDEVVVARQYQKTRVKVHDSFFRDRSRLRLLEVESDFDLNFYSFISYLFMFY